MRRLREGVLYAEIGTPHTTDSILTDIERIKRIDIDRVECHITIISIEQPENDANHDYKYLHPKSKLSATIKPVGRLKDVVKRRLEKSDFSMSPRGVCDSEGVTIITWDMCDK